MEDMETSAPKRRRTSPRTAAPVQTKTTTPTDSPPHPDAPSTKRPSFGSPTKASMERSNPEILRRRGSSSKKAKAGGILANYPFGRRDRLRPSLPPGFLPEPEPGEEDEGGDQGTEGILPPTPQHPDPVVSTPPSGIHHTPSKRPARSRQLAARIASSPLNPRPVDFPLSAAARIRGPTGHLRALPPLDPDAEKKGKRDALLANIADLESHLELARRESERVRSLGLVGLEPTPPEKAEEILALLDRCALPPEKEAAPDPARLWAEAALDPIALLPFGQAPSSSSLPSLFSAPTEAKADEADVALSHHPIPMTAAEALPYVQALTPLTFGSSISTLPPDPGEASSLRQRHVISVASSAPWAGLFAARIELTVDTGNHSVAQLRVPRLDPAATAELHPLVEVLCGDGGGNSALARNVNVLTWAMGTWLRSAVRRAEVWRRLDAELGSEEKLRELVAGMRTRKRRRRGRARPGGRKGSQKPAVGEEKDGEEEEEEEEEEKGRKAGSGTQDLLPYMGRTAMEFEIATRQDDGGRPGDGDADRARVRLQWKMEFDWAGEVRNKIGVLVGAPARWHQADDRARVASLPTLFDELLEAGEDPAVAVKKVVALLAGEPLG
ncbi:hypothetical protein P8C59_001040 [Phyllachora maydis]|uniref:Uncharacterized protein n=1 Tax=Phyllachora maydis TaxID=1825666 RepID=A0AAD9HYJ4_9PEZI|nr:hypothetical protein P8C59_001040 [Phyllachora maydis]